MNTVQGQVLAVGSALPETAPAADREKNPSSNPLELAVDEFRIQTRNLGMRPGATAAAGRSAGPKPQWHGRIFENLRNDVLDAVPHEIAQRGGNKSLLRRNQFGFNVAGPVVIPRLFNGTRTTFFSFSYEGMRERISRSRLLTVATPLERTGDFSGTVDQAGNALPVYDPQSTRSNPDYTPSQPVSNENLQYLRDVFPGGKIPMHRLDPTAMDTVRQYPEANTSVGPFNRNNYFVVSPESNTANGVILKIDHSLTARHRVTFNGATSNGFAGSARLMPGPLDSSPPDRDFRSRYGHAEHIFTVSPRTVNTVSFSAGTYTSQNVSDIFPMYHFGPYVATGKWNPAGRYTETNYTLSDGVSFKRNRHSLRLTLQHLRQQVATYSDWTPHGYYQFGSGLTSLPGIINTGNPFASFLLGMAEYGEVTRVGSPSYFHRTLTNGIIRDQYEIRPELTLTASLNLEVSTPRTEKYDRQSTIDLEAINPENGRPGALVAAGANGQGRAFQPVRGVLEPSIGMSWNTGSRARFVVRANYARSYSSVPIGGSQFGTQGFNASPSFISTNTQLEPAITLSQPLPVLSLTPDLRPDVVNNMIGDYIEPGGRMPRYQSAGVSLEREMPGSAVLTLGFGHADGKNLFVGTNATDLNAIPLDNLSYRDRLNEESFRRTLRPYPQYVTFELNGLYPLGRYQRDSGYLKLEKRSSRGLSLTATYEYVKQMDDYSGSGVQDFFNRNNDWSRTPYLNPHRFSVTYVYELPFGPGKSLFPFNDWRRYIIEGWSLSGMTQVNGGDPLGLRPQFNNTGGVVRNLNVNVVPGVDPSVSNPSADLWFNPAAFTQPEDFSIGNASRTHPYLMLPGSQNHDLSVTKRIAIGTERAIELSAVGFNFINHANLNDPDTVIGPASAPNVQAGKIIGSVGGRVIQVGLRYSF